MGKNFFQCVLGKALVKLCHFISLPLLTFYLPLEEMGLYQLLLGGFGIFIEASTFGIRQYFVVKYFTHQTMRPRFHLLADSVFIILRLTGALFLLAFLILLWRFDNSLWLLFFFAFLQAYFSIFNYIYLTMLQLQMKFLRLTTVTLAYALLQTSLVIAAVVGCGFQLRGLFSSLLITEAALLGYYLWTSRKGLALIRRLHILKKPSRETILKLLKLTVIFVPSTLSFWLLMNIDQWMLGSLVGLEAVGLYAFAGKFPLLFDYLFSSSLILVYTPYLYERLRDRFVSGGNYNALFALAALMASGLVFYLSGKSVFLIKPLIPENYHDALEFIPPLLFAACIRFSTHILQLMIRYKLCLSFILFSNGFAAAANAGMNYVLIPAYGIRGCLMATAGTFLLMFFVNLVFHQYLVRQSLKEVCLQHAG